MVAFCEITENDISEIQKLARIIWFSHYPGIISHEQIEYMLKKMYSEDIIHTELINGYYWYLVKNDNIPVGFISISKEEKGTEYWIKLNKLYVLTEYHGIGIGQNALSFVKNRAFELGASKIYLAVNKLNKKAIAAYNKSGFFIEKEVVTNIGDGFVMDDYIMAMVLSA
jgi:RimJ/RimL family protein N-acetyltransferase